MNLPQKREFTVTTPGGQCRIIDATIPERTDPAQREATIGRLAEKLKAQNAVLVSHYYVDGELQDLAEASGGIVADSLEMARFGAKHPAETIIVAGVRFMGETAKILSPEKNVRMVEMGSECSLDLSCPEDEFAEFIASHPEREVVVYANTSAAVKAMADWVVTSSIAVKLAQRFAEEGKKIIWAPDKHLGTYVQKQTGVDLIAWQGACVVHDEFRAIELETLKAQMPEAAVLVHPESPASVVALADAVGSTSQILAAAKNLPNQTFIVATDAGMMHKLRQDNPDKTFIAAPTSADSQQCNACAFCPWMGMNTLAKLEQVLDKGGNDIIIDEHTLTQARLPLERMLSI